MKAPGAAQSNERWRELQRENSRLREENERLRKEKERLESENQRLEKELEAARRAAKRQAAPFSKGQPKSNPNLRVENRGRLMGSGLVVLCRNA